MLDAVIGLGANLGDPIGSLVGAVQHLQRTTQIVALSPLYRSAPVGGPRQPDYFNAGARLRFDGDAPQLLALLLAIEQTFGRQRSERWGPRTLDLDLLWLSGLRVVSTELTVPHPRLVERAFALAPLVALAPTAEDPHSGELYEEVLNRLGEAGLQPVTDARWDSLRASLCD